MHLDCRGTGSRPDGLPSALEFDRLAAIDGLTGLSSPQATRGDPHVTDVLTLSGHPPISLRRHVLAFFQGNRYLLNQLVAHVVEQVPLESEVVDLYAGVGVFAVAAAAIRGARVTAVEGDRVAAADLIVNAATIGGAVVAVHQAVEGFVGNRRSLGRGGRPDPDALIVDPPRTGTSREALDGIIRFGASRIVYVSCDVATLARDARRLIDAGYRLARVDAFDLFPNTPHVETVAVLDKPRRCEDVRI
jgi:tRNA/tmRNA/rRNA uracil-C5-methylase (TrmA/RlmC/RlmD family)